MGGDDSWQAESGLIKSVATPLVSQEGSCFYTKTLPSLCPPVSGYPTAYSDHVGDDIGKKASIADAAAACNADVACKGFNNLGYYKNRLYPTEASSLCLCPPISGYSSQANADHLGDDIGRKANSGEAATACSLDPNCRGCQNIPGYTVQANVDHWVDDIGKASSGAAASLACNADDTCKGFNSLGWYKHEVAPAFVSDYCLCAFVPGYSAKAFADHAANMWDAASACNADVACKGFNSGGWYKFNVVPNIASDFCL
ncbi:hypothetical protein HYH03_019155 [Edaphochlamys debaryana]|uniref:Uncharacterized protein n=1 Tax=Edaphochlamys debaryana TaxID=47281 RepID=A0A835XFM4_9CHLO|nr:hypothetical protein HYH03_019155 [Edaphochlamys debaryana]|eukprot:KAG2481883.1 hypothetical protein HYH03_019155 [Edaphochlamys debaryana]